jgi:hypothetical protein
MSPFVEGFGCRPVMVVPRGLAAGVRKPAIDETAMGDKNVTRCDLRVISVVARPEGLLKSPAQARLLPSAYARSYLSRTMIVVSSDGTEKISTVPAQHCRPSVIRRIVVAWSVMEVVLLS